MTTNSNPSLTASHEQSLWLRIARLFEQIDRRIIYLLVPLSLSIPLVTNWTLPPAHMKSASSFYEAVDRLVRTPGQIVLIAADWGPGTKAENEAQTAVAVEHLMRKRIPFALITTYQLGAPFLEQVPREIAKKLMAELPDQQWEYGRDWVNLGYRFGGFLMIQGLAKTDNIIEQLKADANGTPLEHIPVMQDVNTIKNIAMLMEFTGLVGVFNDWIQLFQTAEYRPPVVHGCTSITIPEAYIYLSSKQIIGLHEGIAGAAWYEKLLNDHYPARSTGSALRINTSLAVAHVVIIALLVVGNIGYFARQMHHKRNS